ncbi:MAG: Quinolinate synthase A [Methanoregulaceae archaeon PtaB.Bin108]|nr:MAG: Quinolinate synthase A [Methanoregulaceae archaeon PtaB.Bin108]OPY46103.1 MAG: Quinolinate synthase A [Methanoregulaceae archaeon PtaU1.Bin222]
MISASYGMEHRTGERITGLTALEKEISSLKEERDAVILAHNYQVPAVQDIADFVGDSLELARAAAALDCAVIVFCGVDFMAETAAILSPDKTVLLPSADACCPMAEMVTSGELAVLKGRYPDAAVVSYVNTTADVKAASDICCTSANAVRVVESLAESRVIFVPDRNLAGYVARFSRKEILPWDGFCIVHDRFSAGDVLRERAKYRRAEVLVHPECRSEVIDLADHVFSTSGIIRHVCESTKDEFIIGTETGILHQIGKRCPGKRCVPLSPSALCVNMKKTTLEKVHAALVTMKPRIIVPPDTAVPARQAIERMLAVP